MVNLLVFLQLVPLMGGMLPAFFGIDTTAIGAEHLSGDNYASLNTPRPDSEYSLSSDWLIVDEEIRGTIRGQHKSSAPTQERLNNLRQDVPNNGRQSLKHLRQIDGAYLSKSRCGPLSRKKLLPAPTLEKSYPTYNRKRSSIGVSTSRGDEMEKYTETMSLCANTIASGKRVSSIRHFSTTEAKGESTRTGYLSITHDEKTDELDARQIQASPEESMIFMDRRLVNINDIQIWVHSIQFDPTLIPLDLSLLSHAGHMKGLTSLSRLASQERALVAINGGFFNRNNRLPLGALRKRSIWLSGPILNRGAIGWDAGKMPTFGRLSLLETVFDSRGRYYQLSGLNSGYAKRGIFRYTSAWGTAYQPITGLETAIITRNGKVVRRLELSRLNKSIPLTSVDELLVARGGIDLPWHLGDTLIIESHPSHAVGAMPNIIGGGPLLLLDGRIVLNGIAEGFNPTFLSQSAPRSVIASDGRYLWFLTLHGSNGPGLTLSEAAVLLRRLGLRDALNLDGGSSATLLINNMLTTDNQLLEPEVHNGLGLVPSKGSE